MNLQEKLSGLKGLVSHSQSKRRFKNDLTVDMISPPLGDFRHTMHVGRGGDVFGDTSFLSNHGGGGSKDLSPAPPAISPIIKNAISLPSKPVLTGNYGEVKKNPWGCEETARQFYPVIWRQICPRCPYESPWLIISSTELATSCLRGCLNDPH
uniref:CDC42 effector protein (Rho GTPase binding) 1a n=1 Tax=Scophthalmus maximus TaxID=52904 RepID=A0A8D3DRZ7_SCOMX